MSLKKTARCLLALGSLAVAPLYAQTNAGANTTVGINPEASHPNAPASSMRSHRNHSSAKSAIWNDSTRIASLLHDARANVTVSAPVWKTVANEANVLANRIYARSAGTNAARRLATELRMHVRLLRKAALAGDAAGVRQHATEALPYANQLADWSAPDRM
jgi:hypothetical protein